MDVRSARRDIWPWVGLASALGFLALAMLVVRRGGLAFDEPPLGPSAGRVAFA